LKLQHTTQNFELSQKFYFEAAHTLSRTVDAQGSRQIHGHTYEAEITLTGQRDPASGMVLDLAYVRQEIERVRAMLDHHFLDDIGGLGPATLENLCLFIKEQLLPTIAQLSAVTISRRASGDKCTLRLTV
jgi:6-pyruvoyltetrahydropterin/6-carboxytetrahydropterin synthase